MTVHVRRPGSRRSICGREVVSKLTYILDAEVSAVAHKFGSRLCVTCMASRALRLRRIVETIKAESLKP
jgi:hypothetical protein